jgi:hypothetical protein
MATTFNDNSMDVALEKMISPELTEPAPEPEPEPEPDEDDAPEPDVSELDEDQPDPDVDDEPGEEEDPDLDRGESDDVEIEASDDQSGAKKYKVKVDGVETDVSLEDLKRGFSGQQYVQKGMQEAAAVRKEAEGVFNELQNERRQVAQYLQNLQNGVQPPPREPDQALFQTDPIGYMEQKIQFDEASRSYGEQMQKFEQVAGEQSQADKHAMEAYLQGEMRQLQAVDPDFREPESAGKVKDLMIAKGQEIYGYQPEEIGQIVDHRAIRVLRDAIRYREIVEGKKTAKHVEKQKMAKSTSKKRVTTSQARRRKQQDKLRNSGSLDDAMGLLFQ